MISLQISTHLQKMKLSLKNICQFILIVTKLNLNLIGKNTKANYQPNPWDKQVEIIGLRLWRTLLFQNIFQILPFSLSRYSSAPKTERIFQMLRCIFEGCTNRARPSQPFLKNCQNGTFYGHYLVKKCLPYFCVLTAILF